MEINYEHWAVIQYVRNLSRSLGARSAIVQKLVSWVESEGSEVGLSFLAPGGEDHGSSRRRRFRPNQPEKGLQDVHEVLDRFFAENRAEAPGVFQQNIDAIAREFGLDPLEQGIFEAAVRYATCHQFERLCDEIMPTRVLSLDGMIAKLLAADPEAVRVRMKPSARLYRLGLVVVHLTFKGQFDSSLKVPNRVLGGLMPPNHGVDDFRRAVAGKPQLPELGWEDFGHVATDRDFLLPLLSGAMREKARGINILLYGPPGTGKTEFAKVLAAKAGLSIYSIGESDDEGSMPKTSERIAGIQIASALLAGAENSMLLFDEMEDLLSRSRDREDSSLSKVFLNRLLENNPVPVIWTTNDTDCFDPALLRRMTYALEMKVPPRKVREGVWQRLLERQSVEVPGDEVRKLARDFCEAPALAASAVRAARLAGGQTEQVRQAVRSVSVLMRGEAPEKKPEKRPDRYDLSLVNADADLVNLSGHICSLENSRRVSLCLSGPPGTGKTAFVRHLAREMGIEVIQKRASDLLSMWVGGSEKNIAAAFRHARDEEAFLVFDEADSLLQDRNLAQRSWEVTQVNEMLTWMESHDWPFACTTNFSDRLDAASLRRFTFKVTLKFMSPEQCRAAFRLYFGTEPPDGSVLPPNLTPGDFALVHRKAGILGQLGNPEILCGLLWDEANAKIRERRVGFMQPVGSV
ncbi:MAG: ATP-binding protein [Deltaproteobacteria bacterium]|nr:ATP-binding protein [Deltaproteobacteria bacterium]